MTDEQNEKIQWLNRAYHSDKKIDSLRKLRDKNKKYRDTSTKEQLKRDNERIEIELLRIMKYKDEIESAIAAIRDDELEAIMNMRYLCYMPIAEIANQMYYDRRTIHRKHLQALEKITCPTMSH